VPSVPLNFGNFGNLSSFHTYDTALLRWNGEWFPVHEPRPAMPIAESR
jgi:hypothetical protein